MNASSPSSLTPPAFALRAVSFFKCSADPRDLHSFPTRRSSDLMWSQLGSPGALEFGQQFAAGRAPDRKSTRLNSSHRTISYAVFCLKKKKARAIRTWRVFHWQLARVEGFLQAE